jgi:hypothetical protein
VLSIEDRMYQRLLAHDQEEAAELAEDFMKEAGSDELYDKVLIPVLSLSERDRHDETLTDDRSDLVLRTLAELIDQLPEGPKPNNGSSQPPSAPAAEASHNGPAICIVPARGRADELVGTMVVKALSSRNVSAEVISTEQLRNEVLDRVVSIAPRAVLISALPPAAILHASFFCKRLSTLIPDLRIIVALWHSEGPMDKARARLQDAGASAVVTTLPAALEALSTAAYAVTPQTTTSADHEALAAS